jgi:hypothetical protein
MDPSDRCSALSLAVGEPLLGTAPTTSEWLLVEHPGPWERDPIDSLPEPSRATLAAWLEAGDRRLQLIRRPTRRVEGDGVLVVRADLRSSTLLGRRLPSLEALEVPWPGEEMGHPMVLVCVHGRRDRCCAEKGRAVVNRLVEEMPEHLWETSHLGGHRFAATAAILPAGRVLGRLSPQNAGEVIRDAMDGRPTAHDRGQAGLDEQEQVASAMGGARPGEVLVRPASCGAEPTEVRPWVPAQP